MSNAVSGLQHMAVLAETSAFMSVCLVMQCSIPGYHYHICLDYLPVGTTQSVDDALDSTEDRRGQALMLMYWLICLLKDPSSRSVWYWSPGVSESRLATDA